MLGLHNGIDSFLLPEFSEWKTKRPAGNFGLVTLIPTRKSRYRYLPLSYPAVTGPLPLQPLQPLRPWPLSPVTRHHPLPLRTVTVIIPLCQPSFRLVIWYDFLEGQSENEGVRLGGNPLFPCGFATGTGKPLENVKTSN
jgi:hypothetical protein